MTDSATDLRVSLDPEGADAEELDELTSQLRRELLELDVQSVERPAAGSPPPGVRSAGAMAIGELVVHGLTAPALVTGVVTVVQAWLRRAGQRGAVIKMNGRELTVTGVGGADQRELIRQFGADAVAGAEGVAPEPGSGNG